MESLFDQNLFRIIFAASFIAITASFLGAFVIIRRMSLVGDVLSHVALPGMGLALLFNIDPIWGAAVFLVLAALGTWFLEKKTLLPPESIIGVFFTAALALGVLITPKEELLESLFGNLFSISSNETWILVLLSLAILFFAILIRKKLLLGTISQDLAKASGLEPNVVYLIFFLLFSLSIALGIKFVGALLMGALTILPAAISRNLSASFKNFVILSILIGLFMVIAGTLVAHFSGFPPGPAIILVGILIFVISLFYNRNAD